MVKKRYVFVSSLCVHGLLAISLGQYISNVQQQEPQRFSVTLLTSSKGAREPVQVVHKKTAHHKVITKSGAVVNQSTTEAVAFMPSVLYNPAPAYPASAKANGYEGEFSVRFWVNMAGNVERVDVIPIKGDKGLFEEELLKTLKTWKFSPCDKPVSFEVPISFRLD